MMFLCMRHSSNAVLFSGLGCVCVCVRVCALWLRAKFFGAMWLSEAVRSLVQLSDGYWRASLTNTCLCLFKDRFDLAP
ncbi:unnamed protein product [Enterobius vermicularis]|uniref:Secreted protein n=1 Tax=Enterobius vermicularis TaxID=51028 RepID=A0A0N4UX65_ENTVE|nr:unnamed protein product [Enterobius vermicularis]